MPLRIHPAGNCIALLEHVRRFGSDYPFPPQEQTTASSQALDNHFGTTAGRIEINNRDLLTKSTRQRACRLGSQGERAITHNDAIRLAFNRTLKKCKLESTGRTFKNIRKTSANALAEQFEDNRIVDVFLAHSDRANADSLCR